MRDHLFLSYATEDWSFVEWLALRLISEGYNVWCDRFRLLGGESYPTDIDTAIKERTFRFITVLSHHSLRKTNPLKERTLALNLARERKENFLIPINLDGLSANDLDWMVSDLTFISFHLGWAAGLAQLLKQLEESDAPKNSENGRSAAVSWFESKMFVKPKEERAWSNVAEIIEFPTDIYRYEMEASVSDEERLKLLAVWPHFADGEIYWSFVYPSENLIERYHLKDRGRIKDWKSARSSDVSVRQIAIRVLNRSLRSHCLGRGLKVTPDGALCYFPDGLFASNRLTFLSFDNKSTWVRTVGVRNFKTITGKEACRYHLAPYLRIWLDHEFGSLLQVRVRLFLTSLEGVPIEKKAALRRRKRICRAWWNYEWLSRTLAILQFLSGDASAIQIGTSEGQKLAISKQPLALQCGWGIDESLLGMGEQESDEADETIVELSEEDSDQEEGPVHD